MGCLNDKHAKGKTAKAIMREKTITEKSLDIARERGLTNDDLLNYDITPSTHIIDADGLLTKPNKCQLVTVLEKLLTKEEKEYKHESGSGFVLDIMNIVRKIPTKKISNFADFLDEIDKTTDIYKSFGRCDLVFDKYSDEPSVKDIEAQRRSKTKPITLSDIKKSTTFPRDLKRFWQSKQNKILLEKLIYTHHRESNSNKYPTVISNIERSNEA